MFLDLGAEIEKKLGGNLPHWHQVEKIQYVTFRLADSLPRTYEETLQAEIAGFKKLNPKPWDAETQRRYWNIIGPREEQLLHSGYGSCILQHPEIRQPLVDAIAHRDNIDYNVLAYVIMPNHVHMLICPRQDNKLEKIIKAIKGVSARRINQMIGNKGKLWLEEYFDRIVRNEETLKYYYRYIQENPRHLPSGTYTLYSK